MPSLTSNMELSRRGVAVASTRVKPLDPYVPPNSDSADLLGLVAKTSGVRIKFHKLFSEPGSRVETSTGPVSKKFNHFRLPLRSGSTSPKISGNYLRRSIEGGAAPKSCRPTFGEIVVWSLANFPQHKKFLREQLPGAKKISASKTSTLEFFFSYRVLLASELKFSSLDRTRAQLELEVSRREVSNLETHLGKFP
jgi:hypothetical protein